MRYKNSIRSCWTQSICSVDRLIGIDSVEHVAIMAIPHAASCNRFYYYMNLSLWLHEVACWNIHWATLHCGDHTYTHTRQQPPCSRSIQFETNALTHVSRTNTCMHERYVIRKAARSKCWLHLVRRLVINKLSAVAFNNGKSYIARELLHISAIELQY